MEHQKETVQEKGAGQTGLETHNAGEKRGGKQKWGKNTWMK